jgi:hypothetical protein
MNKLTLLLILTFFLRLILAFRSDTNIGTRLFNDDSFYLHTVSNNLATGNGLTIDKSHLTNGIQPLIVFLNTPCYYIGAPDKWLGLRLTFILSALIDCFSLIVLYKLLQRVYITTSDSWASPAMIGAILWAFSYPLIAQTMNGMETGILTLFILLSAYNYLQFLDSNSNLQAALTGICLGFMVLARVDSAILVLIIVIHQLFKRQIIKGITIGATAFLISLPWWIYNYANFGSIFPTSGTSEMLGGPSLEANLLRLIATLGDLGFFVVTIPFYKVSVPVQLLWGLAGILLALNLIRGTLKQFSFDKKTTSLIALWSSYALFLLIFYTALFHAPYFLPRYAQPLRILLLILFAGAFSYLLQLPRLKCISYCIGIAMIIGLTIFYTNQFTATGVNELYRVGLWAENHANEVIGMQQSGVAGFVADNVINLDGKVNAEVLDHMKQNKRGEYIAKSNIAILADWKEFAEVLRNEAREYGADFTPFDSIGLVTFYKRSTLTNQAATRK